VWFSAGRTKKMVVQNKHAVNDNPVMPPFPEDTEMAMFGESPVVGKK